MIGFFILAACALKYLHERRLRARLQSELNSLLYEYVSMDESDVETITFFNSSGIMDGKDKNATTTTTSSKGKTISAPTNNNKSPTGDIRLSQMKSSSKV